MIELLLQYAVPGLIGGLAGFGTSYLGWDVKQREIRHQRRIAAVAEWRRELVSQFGPDDPDGAVHTFQGHFISKLPAYASLRPHLSPSARAFFEGEGLKPGRDVIVRTGGPAARRLLIEEIGRIEQKWKLI